MPQPEKYLVTLDDQIAEVKAELALRQNVYRNWIAGGRMKRETGSLKFARLRAALHSLMEIREQATSQVPRSTSVIGDTRQEEGLPW